MNVNLQIRYPTVWCIFRAFEHPRFTRGSAEMASQVSLSGAYVNLTIWGSDRSTSATTQGHQKLRLKQSSRCIRSPDTFYPFGLLLFTMARFSSVWFSLFALNSFWVSLANALSGQEALKGVQVEGYKLGERIPVSCLNRTM